MPANLITGTCQTLQPQITHIHGYVELVATVTTGQGQSTASFGTISGEPPGPQPEPQPQANRGGSGTYYGPWGAPFLVPLDLSHLVAPTKRDYIDVAVRFGKGEQWARANATNTLRERTVTVETTEIVPAVDRSMSFIKNLPPKKVDTSLSFIKSLTAPSIINEQQPAETKEEVTDVLESLEVIKNSIVETTVSVSNIKQIIKEDTEQKPGISVKVNFLEVI